MIEAEEYSALHLEKRSVRRLLVLLYWAVVLPAACELMVSWNHTRFLWQLSLQVIVVTTLSLGGIKPGGLVKFYGRQQGQQIQILLGGSRASSLDERELALTARVHLLAYRAAMLATLLMLIVAAVMASWHREWLAPLAVGFLFLQTLRLWSMPQSILLWTEPEVDRE